MIDRISVLLVEDNLGDARLIREMLRDRTDFGSSYRVTHVETLRAAEAQLSLERFDIVLLDIHLPDSNGLDTLKSICNLNPEIPVIVLTGLSDHLLSIQAVSNGAQDYIPKNECNSRLLKRVIHYAIERQQAEEKLKYLAMHDVLTGLPNRGLLYDRLRYAFERSRRKAREGNARWKLAVMMLDLDNFKWINDHYGHESGDKVLQQVARRLESCLRHSDSIARWGGDEFVIVLEGVRDRSDCQAVNQKILDALNTPPLLEEKGTVLSATIGISLFPDDAEDFDSLLRDADRSMYSAKNLGKQSGVSRGLVA